MQNLTLRAESMNHSTYRRINRFSNHKAARRAQVMCEALEQRQMLTLTVSLIEAGGATSATVTSVGQVIDLELIATVTSPNGIPTQDALETATGNIVSTYVDGHAIAGNLNASNVAPFMDVGAGPGTDQDLNGEGNIDVGSKFQTVVTDGVPAIDTTGIFSAVSSEPQPSTAGTVVDSGTAVQYEIGTVTYTVTNLNEGGTTDINFVPESTATPDLPEGAAWYEENDPCNNIENEVTGAPESFQAGTPFTVSDASLIVAPTAVPDTATVIRNTPTAINVLANDDFVVPLNPASVTIGTAPAHGTAIPQTNGEVLYTPDNGYTGPDSFTYTVDDQGGRVSNAATVSITVTKPPPPTAGAVSSTAIKNEPDTITVLSSDSTTSPATLIPSSVAVVTAPTNGTAVAQPNGTIIYTPTNGYTGTDTFTYTVADTNSETSSPGTVTVTVQPPVPPTAGDASGSTTAGAPISINVLTDDSTPQGTLNPASIIITTAPTNGTAVPQSNGTILYTPTPRYVGSDSFSYTIDDSFGDVSTPGTVTVTIAAGLPPIANPITAPVLSGTTTSINVLANSSSAAPLVPTSVAIITQPLDGTAKVNPSTGAVSYVPNPGFVGTDTFTYTVMDVNQDTSSPATVTLSVGTSISSAKGSPHALSFADAKGGPETISLNAGTADLFFDGTDGHVTVSKSGKATVTGSGLAISGITLTGTTKASVLSIRGVAKDTLSVGGISDAGPLGSISAPNVALTGTVTLNSAGAMSVQSISDATITVGAGLPGRLILTTGAVTDTTLASSVPILSLKAASWSATSGGITAPSMGTMTVAGTFDADLSLTAAGKALALTSARINGALAGPAWTIPGTIGSLTVGSVTSGWAGAFGTVNALTIKAGGFSSTPSNGSAAALTTGAIGTLIINGNVTGNITASSARSIRVNGDFNSSNMAVSGAVGQWVVTGDVIAALLTTGGSLTSFTARSLEGSQLTAGVPSSTTLATAAATNLGSAAIGSIRLTGKTGDQFSNSVIMAANIGSASVGSVTTNNGGTSEGIAVKSIDSFSGIFSGNSLHASHGDLVNPTVLSSFTSQQGVSFGDFEISLL